MIICQNCGTTNNEKVSHTCRTCGALLPVSSKSSRSKRLKAEKKNKEKQQEIQLELQEIPEESENIFDKVELHQIPEPEIEELEDKISEQGEIEFKEDKSEILQEIPAPPYRGTLIEHSHSSIPTPPSYRKDSISEAFTELKSSVLEDINKTPSTRITPIPLERAESEEAILRQKQLEKDMTKVLSFLSKKITVKKLELPEDTKTEMEKPKEEIPPSSMNEILKRLLNLDLNIEASAIIKTDGTILASAISSRISDSLFATIGMNLSMIGTDIIEGLGAGNIKSISLKATGGVLDLAPIDQENPSVKDMFLIILSHPKVKSGIIAMAVSVVKKQIKEYLGLKKRS
ncbi:MAG: hypothetical protein JSV62_09265 [Promethearchaeota archaeon]|nr:MAG: hypothetical protein JSV62_09265 [Candidatus Lokiarchaeota archaeon]